MLYEIHISKNSYCSFLEPEHHQYDYILDLSDDDLNTGLSELVTEQVIAQAKENRCVRMNKELSTRLEPSDIPTTDLVFRVMTWDHIPSTQKPTKKTTKKQAKDILVMDDDPFLPEDELSEEEYARVNFPPFQHFKLDENNVPYCVGKSHWEGGLQNGYFSVSHGKTTRKLAHMYTVMCEKYAMKHNWRGYTYIDEMRASAAAQLALVGLRFNEAKSQNPFAYYTATITNAFCRVLNIEKKNQEIRDDLLEHYGYTPSFARQMKDTHWTGKK